MKTSLQLLSQGRGTLVRQLGLVLVMVFLLTLVGAPEASAQSLDSNAGGEAVQILAQQSSGAACVGGGPVDNLAINRWGASTSTVWRGSLDSGFFGAVGDAATAVIATIRNVIYGILTAPAFIIWLMISWGANTVLPGVANMSCSPYMSDLLVMMNEYFGRFFETVRDNGMIFTVILVGIISMMPLLAGGGVRSARFTTALIGFIIPLGVLTGMAFLTPASSPGQLRAGQPAWMVYQAMRITEGPVWHLTEGVMNSMGTRAQGTAQPGAGGGRACGAYISNLYSSSVNTHPMTEVVSATWESTRLQGWYYAQFGNFRVGQLTGCRILEAKRGTPVEEQVRVGGGHPDIYLRGEDDPDGLYKMLGWLFCSSDEFGYMLEAEVGGNKDAACNDWWSNGTMVGKIDNGRIDTYRERRIQAESTYAGNPGALNNIQVEYAALQSMSGEGSAMSIMTSAVIGVVSLVEAGGAGALLGVPMFGMVMSLVVITVTMAFLPVTLLFFAIGEARKYKVSGFIGDKQTSERMGSIGRKMLGWTGMSLMFKFFFTLALAASLLFLDVSHRVLGMILQGSGAGPSVPAAFTPLNVEFVARIVGTVVFLVTSTKALAASAQRQWGAAFMFIVSAAVGVLLTFNPGIVQTVVDGVGSMFGDFVSLF